MIYTLIVVSCLGLSCETVREEHVSQSLCEAANIQVAPAGSNRLPTDPALSPEENFVVQGGGCIVGQVTDEFVIQMENDVLQFGLNNRRGFPKMPTGITIE